MLEGALLMLSNFINGAGVGARGFIIAIISHQYPLEEQRYDRASK
jgi:hypothetical protein